MTQTEGYMIALKPQILLQRYEEFVSSRNWSEEMRKLREAFSMFKIDCYRGISREPLSPFPSLDQKIIDEREKCGWDMKSNAEARRRFREILGEPTCDLPELDQIDEDLLPSINDAKEVLALADNPSIWEIVHVCYCDVSGKGTLLGYDVGYWGGDHYSIIADTIVIPRWHAPDPEDYAEVASALSWLNENLLFRIPEDALNFKKYYKTKPWAETEFQDEFQLIRISNGVH